jgi:YVTN family beta-propeller protein
MAAAVQAQVPITPVINIPNTGQQITPLAPRGSSFTYINPGLVNYPNWLAEMAVSAVTSPDGKTLVVLTTGNYGVSTSTGAKDFDASTDFLFIYDIKKPVPVLKQVIQVPYCYNGIVFDPNGKAFYLGGGSSTTTSSTTPADNVRVYTFSKGKWNEDSVIPLGNTAQVSGVNPEAAGIAITGNGKKLVITNYENDSISVLTKSGGDWSITATLDLRPGVNDPAETGVPGGEYPFWVSIKGKTTAYVSSIRDREIVAVDISHDTPVITERIRLTGQPLKSTLSPDERTLYVSEDQADSVAAIDTRTNSLLQEVRVVAPQGVIPPAHSSLSGVNTNSVTVSPDGSRLYVTNGNANSVAVVSLPEVHVLGLIPTGMYPTSVAVSGNGQHLYVVNGKSPSGPNPNYCSSYSASPCYASNEYSLQLIKAGLQFLPVPGAAELSLLTNQVAVNNHWNDSESSATSVKMDFIASKIKHVVYIIKENRTYDQVLGDIPGANGDVAFTVFGDSITPNLHNLATQFVTLDNFYDTAEVSFDGWAWSTGIVSPDIVLRHTPLNYALRNVRSLDYIPEGNNRNVNMIYRAYSSSTAPPVTDPNILPGLTNVAAPDGPGNQVNTGYIWNQALRAGLTVRNYGFFVNNLNAAVPFPQNQSSRQVNPANPDLNPNTDVHFRGYDMNNADYYLYEEWASDFDNNYSAAGFPNLTLIRLPHDHMGNFSTALAQVNTPELEVADNDYAVGSVVDKIAHSIYKDSTLIFVIEDDAQDGPDHVDAHRSTAFIVGPYVKQGGAVVSTQYNTINFLRTIERVLGLPPAHLNDASAQPMADVFDVSQATWTYKAAPASILYNTALPLPPMQAGLPIPKPAHDASYWARVMSGFDFSDADRVDPNAFNRILWQGMKGNQVYPGDANPKQSHKLYKEALQRKGVTGAVDRDGD